MACVAACISACGRLGFELVSDDDLAHPAPDACAFGPWRRAAPQPFGALNTTRNEWGVQIAGDGLTVVYSSTRHDPADPRPDDGHESIYLAQRATKRDPFGARRYLARLNDPRSNARDPSPTPDLQELFFVDELVAGKTCIFESRFDAGANDWGAPTAFDALCLVGARSIHGVWISDDGLRLYYDSVTAGERQQVWVTQRAQRGDAFAGVGARVEGLPEGMTYCSLSSDERTIYCEAAAPLLSGQDVQVWRAMRSDRAAAFGATAADQAQPVPELASELVDGDPSITSDGTQLVYASGLDAAADLVLLERACQ